MKIKQTHFLCMFSRFVWLKINKKGNRMHILLWLCNLINFLLSFHPPTFILLYFAFSLKTYLSEEFLLKLWLKYHFLFCFWYEQLYFCTSLMYKDNIFNFLGIIYVFKYLRQRIKIESNKHQLTVFLGVSSSVFFLLVITWSYSGRIKFYIPLSSSAFNSS